MGNFVGKIPEIPRKFSPKRASIQATTCRSLTPEISAVPLSAKLPTLYAVILIL